MYTCCPRSQIADLAPYTPGLSVDEIRQKYGLANIIKMASNENPLGTSPLVQEALKRHAGDVFRYPRGGNPRLIEALARHHDVAPDSLVVGNGSDEIIDLLIRILADPAEHTIVCSAPCFALYPIQSHISGVTLRRTKLNDDFSFDFNGLLSLVDEKTRLVFLTTPDNPSGYCPDRESVRKFADEIARKSPSCLLLIDEAYMDFAADEASLSFLTGHCIPENVGIMRTFSKSYGLAGLRLGYAVLPKALASLFWRARLPFSVNILAEEAGLAALSDTAFREATLETVKTERKRLSDELSQMGCRVWPSSANYLLFALPEGKGTAEDCFTALLQGGIIIRLLKSYSLPDHIRVSVGNTKENTAFLKAMRSYLSR